MRLVFLRAPGSASSSYTHAHRALTRQACTINTKHAVNMLLLFEPLSLTGARMKVVSPRHATQHNSSAVRPSCILTEVCRMNGLKSGMNSRVVRDTWAAQPQNLKTHGSHHHKTPPGLTVMWGYAAVSLCLHVCVCLNKPVQLFTVKILFNLTSACLHSSCCPLTCSENGPHCCRAKACSGKIWQRSSLSPWSRECATTSRLILVPTD